VQSQEKQKQPLSPSMTRFRALIPLALVRSQMAGWDVSGFAADGEGVIGCLGGVLVITLAVLWPLAELYRQRDFLLRAQTAWEGGLVFVHKDSGKPRRAD
jgi:hypothetical protein